jgi:hypothetical protein
MYIEGNFRYYSLIVLYEILVTYNLNYLKNIIRKINLTARVYYLTLMEMKFLKDYSKMGFFTKEYSF